MFGEVYKFKLVLLTIVYQNYTIHLLLLTANPMIGERQSSPETQLETAFMEASKRTQELMNELTGTEFKNSGECRVALKRIYDIVRKHNTEVLPHISQDALRINQLSERTIHTIEFTVDGARVELQLARVGTTPELHIAPTIYQKTGSETVDVVPE